ncbi:MAG: response regulator [Chloroflexota bacterium]
MNSKILIVDDEPHIRMLIEQTLETLVGPDVELFTATNGEEALDLIQIEQPNLVFLDVMMPKVSGFEVCRLVKQVFNFHHIYIVMLTAKGQEFDKEQGKEVGVDQYITKPFNPDQLAKIAKSVIVTS